MRAIFFAFLLCISQVSFAKQKLLKAPKDLAQTYLVYSLRTYPGMFASCVCVLGFLDLCEQGKIAGGRVDFGTEGVYYDPLVGENWWEYYFEPISVSFKPAKKTAGCDRATTCLCGMRSKKLSMQRMQDLNRRYVKIKPHILKQVDGFQTAYFQDFHVLGVHYRGTDKSKETSRVPYESVFIEIEKAIAALPNDHYKIFVCTDEEAFLKEISGVFPDKILCTNATRSTDLKPIHFAEMGQYRLGEEALIDCQLLSRCHLLIRTPSYFSQYAGVFNPQLPVILVER